MCGASHGDTAEGIGPPAFVTIGRVLRAHGVHGSAIVEPLTDQMSRFDAGAALFLGPERESVTVADARPYKGKLLVRFEELRDRSEVDERRRQELVIAADQLGSLPADELWIFELVGRKVHDAGGREIGVVAGIAENPAHDLLVVRDQSDTEILVPMVAEFMEPLDREADDVIVHPPPGLLPGT